MPQLVRKSLENSGNKIVIKSAGYVYNSQWLFSFLGCHILDQMIQRCDAVLPKNLAHLEYLDKVLSIDHVVGTVTAVVGWIRFFFIEMLALKWEKSS